MKVGDLVVRIVTKDLRPDTLAPPGKIGIVTQINSNQAIACAVFFEDGVIRYPVITRLRVVNAPR